MDNVIIDDKKSIEDPVDPGDNHQDQDPDPDLDPDPDQDQDIFGKIYSVRDGPLDDDFFLKDYYPYEVETREVETREVEKTDKAKRRKKTKAKRTEPFGRYGLSFLDINRTINPTYQNFKEPSKGAKIVIMGKTGCGKSILIKKLMYEKRDAIPMCMVISPTEGCSGFFKEFVPPSLIHEKYDPVILSSVMLRQKTAVRWYKQTGHNPWLMLVMDDCMGDKKKIAKDPALPDLMKNSRHFNILSVIVCHDVMDLPPFARSNLDGIFLFKVTAPKTIKKISGELIFIPEKDLSILLGELGDKECIYFDVNGFNANGGKWKKCTHHFKVFPEDLLMTKKFKFCHDQVWDIEDAYGKKNDFSDSEEEDLSAPMGKKRKNEENLLLEGMGRQVIQAKKFQAKRSKVDMDSDSEEETSDSSDDNDDARKKPKTKPKQKPGSKKKKKTTKIKTKSSAKTMTKVNIKNKTSAKIKAKENTAAKTKSKSKINGATPTNKIVKKDTKKVSK